MSTFEIAEITSSFTPVLPNLCALSPIKSRQSMFRHRHRRVSHHSEDSVPIKVAHITRVLVIFADQTKGMEFLVVTPK